MVINISPGTILLLASLLIYAGGHVLDWALWQAQIFTVNYVPNNKESFMLVLFLILHLSYIYLIYEVIRHVPPLVSK